MPLVTIASLCRKVSRIAIVNCQVEYLKTIAAMDGLGRVRISTRSSIGLTMPYILIASSSCEGRRIAIVEGQIEYLDTIAAMDCLQVLGIST